MSRAALLKDLGRLRRWGAQEAGSQEVKQVQHELVERISWMGPSYNLWAVMVKHNGVFCFALSYCRTPVTGGFRCAGRECCMEMWCRGRTY